jgi:signal transduction histidine kinase
MTETLRMQAGELSRPPWGPLGWIQRHPRIIDIVVVVAAALPLLIAAILRGEEENWTAAESWLANLAVAVAGTALMWRRRYPLSVLAVVAVACAASPLAQPGFSYPMIPFAFAVYSVAARQSFPRAAIGYGVGMVCTILATLVRQGLGFETATPTIVEPFSLVAIVIGLAVRNRRDHRAALAELVNERIDNAATVERARIAAEMHDLVAHSLSIMVALANGAAAGWDKYPGRARAATGKIAEVGRDALEDMQRVLHILRSSDVALDDNLRESGHNLPTLEALAENITAAGLPVHLHRTGPQLPEDPALQMTIYRIVQEALTNALRHGAGATCASVTLAVSEQQATIDVTNDGPTQQPPAHHGHGLVGIAERAARFGGTSSSAPAPSGGWSTHATLPLIRVTDD